MKRGAKSVLEPTRSEDANGFIVRATIETYGDVVHSFVQLDDYKGKALPGFGPPGRFVDPFTSILPVPDLQRIDHVVGNQPDGQMGPVAKFYEDILQFHQFWSVDDKQIHTEYSALRSIVMADYDEVGCIGLWILGTRE